MLVGTNLILNQNIGSGQAYPWVFLENKGLNASVFWIGLDTDQIYYSGSQSDLDWKRSNLVESVKRSIKQSCVADSTIEDEYVVALEASQRGWINLQLFAMLHYSTAVGYY